MFINKMVRPAEPARLSSPSAAERRDDSVPRGRRPQQTRQGECRQSPIILRCRVRQGLANEIVIV